MKVGINIFLALLCLIIGLESFGQRYLTQNGYIRFFSETPIYEIEAINNQVSSVIDLSNGNMVFSLLMKAFTFEKALMQEHFNEKYVESEKYPKSTFKGQILNFGEVDLESEKQEVKVKGKLSIHGVTQEIEEVGSIERKAGKLIVHSVFTVKVADYHVKIPSTVNDKIAETIEITVKCKYEAMD
jgi:hypothetical protein